MVPMASGPSSSSGPLIQPMMVQFTPQMVTVYDPVSGLPQGTVMMMMPSPLSSAGLPQGAATVMTHSVQSPPIGTGVPQGTVMTDSVRSPPIGAGLPQKRRGRRPLIMDAKIRKERRLEYNKECAKRVRQKNKEYVASLESHLKEVEADNKKLSERLQYLEVFCRVHSFSTLR